MTLDCAAPVEAPLGSAASQGAGTPQRNFRRGRGCLVSGVFGRASQPPVILGGGISLRHRSNHAMITTSCLLPRCFRDHLLTTPGKHVFNCWAFWGMGYLKNEEGSWCSWFVGWWATKRRKPGWFVIFGFKLAYLALNRELINIVDCRLALRLPVISRHVLSS